MYSDSVIRGSDAPRLVVGKAGQLRNAATFALAGILGRLGHPGYTNISHIPDIPYIPLQYIYTLLFWEMGRGVFNNNLIIIFTIISSYKFNNILYYTYPVSNLEHL